MRLEIKTLFIASILLLIGVIVFLSLIPISFVFVLGWLLGTFAAIIGYSVSVLLTNRIFIKKSTKNKAMLIGISKTILSLVVHIVFLIVLISVDLAWHDHGVENAMMNDLRGPINFFTYIGGLGIIVVSTFIASLIKERERT